MYSEVDESKDLPNTDFGRRASSEDLIASIAYSGETFSVVAFGRNLTGNRVEVGIPIADLFAAGIVNRSRAVGSEVTYEMNNRQLAQ